MTLCREATLVKAGPGIHAATLLYCRSWGCDICQPRRRRQLRAKAAAGKPTTFITLTVNPAWGRDADDRARALSHAWRAVRARAMKAYGYDALPFLAIFEATKAGEPHLHILARVRWIDQKWLSDQMRAEIDAPIVDIRRIRSKAMAVHYVAKYVGKQPGRFGTTKRYWCSQDWEPSRRRAHDPDDPDAPEFWVIFRDLWTYVWQRLDDGYEFTEEGEWVLFTPFPPSNGPP